MAPQSGAKLKLYRQCCCLSLGTATTLWASFQLVLSLFQTFGGHSSGAFFVAGSVLSMLTAFLQLVAAGSQSALCAYMGFYLQLMTVFLWGVQFVFLSTIFAKSCQNGMAWKSTVALGKYMLGGDTLGKPMYEHISIPAFSFLVSLLVFYLLLLVASWSLLRMLWSFYRILQAGGTGFEYKTAEEIETALLNAQLPAMENYKAAEDPTS